MSKLAEQLFEGLKRMGEEVGAEASRLGRQGASELAAAIFSGKNDAYVMYGPNQPGQNQEKQPEVEQQQETGIER